MEDDDDTPAVAGTLRAPWKWEELIVEAAVIGGKERWRRRLAGLERELEVHRREIAAEEPESSRLPAIERESETKQWPPARRSFEQKPGLRNTGRRQGLRQGSV